MVYVYWNITKLNYISSTATRGKLLVYSKKDVDRKSDTLINNNVEFSSYDWEM